MYITLHPLRRASSPSKEIDTSLRHSSGLMDKPSEVASYIAAGKCAYTTKCYYELRLLRNAPTTRTYLEDHSICTTKWNALMRAVSR
eukprot:scaffold104304_cov38-Prasinocladus_malaysianus.AAC.1